MKLRTFFAALAGLMLSLPIQTLAEVSASAEQAKGHPVPWQTYFQQPASPMMERLENMHDMLLIMCFGVCIFVLLLLLYVCIRFNARSNPVPSKTTHNTLIEIIWTVIPVMILLAIIIPSWKLIHFMDKAQKSEMTIKAIGYQWYWGYEYVDGPGKGIHFESYIKTADAKEESLKLQPGEPRNLATDTIVVLPVDTDIKILTTGADVIHAWTIPAFGVKMDAVPGRINETWVRITKPGDYYGQCSELCGSKHAFMPIHVKAVSKEEYLAWVGEKSKELGIPAEELKQVEQSGATKTPATGGNQAEPVNADKDKRASDVKDSKAGNGGNKGTDASKTNDVKNQQPQSTQTKSKSDTEGNVNGQTEPSKTGTK